MADHGNNDEQDGRIPPGAPWVITDVTHAMYELRFPPNWTTCMIYFGDYNILCDAWIKATGEGK